jgi:uncharacterized protein (TIGR03905 family)
MHEMSHSFKMHGTCATEVRFKVVEGCLRDVKFKGGCDGNLKAVMKLVDGRPAVEVAEMLNGIRCGRKATSCPDQLSKAILEACGTATSPLP